MSQTLFEHSAHPDAPALAEHCAALFAEISPAFHAVFWNASIGAYGIGLQTEQALPLFLDIVPAHLKEGLLEYVVHDIVETNANHTTSGILGIKYMLEVLGREGRKLPTHTHAHAHAHAHARTRTRAYTRRIVDNVLVGSVRLLLVDRVCVFGAAALLMAVPCGCGQVWHLHHCGCAPGCAIRGNVR